MVPSNIIVFSLFLMLIIQFSDAGTSCNYNLVESMPEGLQLKDPVGANIQRTQESLLEMAKNSKKTLRIATFYSYLTAPPEFAGHPSVIPGRELLEALQDATARGVNLEVVLDSSTKEQMSNPADIVILKKIGTVKFVNMSKILKSGVMHTKFMIADNTTFYVGSSNFDWRSYTEIKEMGLAFRNCPVLAQDLDKIFRTYMLMAELGEVPTVLPDDLKTSINMQNPLVMSSQEDPTHSAKLFIAGSPPPFNGKDDWTGRTDDIDALLHIINSARHRISISVMNYSPRLEFVWPKKYWPRIDDALRQAATVHQVRIELLFSDWRGTRSSELAWYKSLNSIQSPDFHNGGIHVKLFKVPAFDDFQKKIPFARVKHDKYMVTDGGVYLGTSNWAADYFINTAGVSVVIEPENRSRGLNSTLSIVRNFQDIFDRDFNSEYAHEL